MVFMENARKKGLGREIPHGLVPAKRAHLSFHPCYFSKGCR